MMRSSLIRRVPMALAAIGVAVLAAFSLTTVPAAPVRVSAVPAPQSAPVRVASISLCADLLALLVAGPEQLKSVSYLAANEEFSGLWDEVRRRAADPATPDALMINHGLAEELFSLDTDLVLAGRYSARTAASMLNRLGKRVEIFDPVTNLEQARQQILRLGRLLHRDRIAGALVAEMDRQILDENSRKNGGSGSASPLAVVYFPNGYSPGAASLPDDLLRLSGFRNLTADIGVSGSQMVSLEHILMAEPDFIITTDRHPARSQAEDILAHPALRRIMAGKPSGKIYDRDWTCGTPEVALVIERLRPLSLRLQNQQTAGSEP